VLQEFYWTKCIATPASCLFNEADVCGRGAGLLRGRLGLPAFRVDDVVVAFPRHAQIPLEVFEELATLVVGEKAGTRGVEVLKAKDGAIENPVLWCSAVTHRATEGSLRHAPVPQHRVLAVQRGPRHRRVVRVDRKIDAVLGKLQDGVLQGGRLVERHRPGQERRGRAGAAREPKDTL